MKNLAPYLFLLSFLLFACNVKQSTTINTPKEVEAPPEVIIPEIPYILETTDFEQLLKQQTGKVVLINLWATWCKPCVKEMPTLEKLHQNYKNKDLKVIALSLDEINQIDTLVLPFWQEMNLSMDNYVIGGTDRGAVVNSFDPLWMGVVPTTYIFDKTGKKIESITGALSYQQFEKKLLPIINQK